LVWILGILLLLNSCSKKDNGDNGTDQEDPFEFVYVSGAEGYACYRTPAIVTTKQGTILAFCGGRVNNCDDEGDIDLVLKRSTDGGKTWSPIMVLENDRLNPCKNPNPVVLPSGRVLLLWLWNKSIPSEADRTTREVYITWSDDDGQTWVTSRNITSMVYESNWGWYGIGPCHGIIKEREPHQGRLIMPGRIFGPANSNDVEWRPFHYSTALYSDDHGQTWQTSHPFPLFGTGEAALTEISDGSIMYNSREHMSVGNRFIAWIHDGGHLWTNLYRSAELYDGPRGSSYGCMGGMIRLPIDGYDILVYSNLDTEAGMMPGDIGGSNTKEREKISVWASFDGGKTWPVKRLVYDGPSAYSNLGVGRAGTVTEGKIYLLYEGGPEGKNSAV